MRSVAILALAAVGALAFSLPCAAQSGAESVMPKTSSAPKAHAAPQRLAPPNAAFEAARTLRPAPSVTNPAPAAPQAVPAQEAAPVPQNAAVPTAPDRDVPTPAAQTPPAQIQPIQGQPNNAQPQQVQPDQGQALPLQGPPGSALSAPGARSAPHAAFVSSERLLDWISNYRDHPELWKVPPAVHAMRDHGLFKDEEQRWFCAGFIAGVLGTNPKDGPKLLSQMFPMPPKEQEVLIRGIAYSGRPDWRSLLEKNADKMPLRRPLIDDFLNGRRPTLTNLPLDLGGTPGVYAHWGYYAATGQHEPVMRIMQALKWSNGNEDSGFFKKLVSGWGGDANAVDKVTTGGTAKWTLASYAERDRELISLYRAEVPNQPEEIAEPLKDVIEAAELFEAEKIRKEQYGAIEDAERKHFTAGAGMSKGWTAGSVAIATGCVAASALGQAQIAIPCVIGGALYSGAGKLSR